MTHRSPLDKWLVVLDSDSGTPVLIRACTTPWAPGHTPVPCYHTNLHSHHKSGDVIVVPQTRYMRASFDCRVGVYYHAKATMSHGAEGHPLLQPVLSSR